MVNFNLDIKKQIRQKMALDGGTLYYNTFRKPVCVGKHH